MRIQAAFRTAARAQRQDRLANQPRTERFDSYNGETDMTCVYSDPRQIHDRPTALTKFADMVRKAVGSIGRRQRRGRAIQAIGGLSDTQLSDLGYRRLEILLLARRASGPLRRQ